MIRIRDANHLGANGVYATDGAFRIRCFVSNDEGAFDVWGFGGQGRWSALWPAQLAADRQYTIRAELWRRESHDETTI